MKNLKFYITIIILVFTVHKNHAQLSDAAMIAILEQTNLHLAGIQQAAYVMEGSILTVQGIQEAQEIKNTINNDIMWVVSDLIKNSNDVKQIFIKEKQIITKLKNLQSASANTETANYISKVISNSLNTTAELMNLGNRLLTDNATRQSDNERQNFLSSILNNLSSIESMLNNLDRNINQYNEVLAINEENKRLYEQARQAQKNATKNATKN